MDPVGNSNLLQSSIAMQIYAAHMDPRVLGKIAQVSRKCRLELLKKAPTIINRVVTAEARNDPDHFNLFRLLDTLKSIAAQEKQTSALKKIELLAKHLNIFSQQDLKLYGRNIITFSGIQACFSLLSQYLFPHLFPSEKQKIRGVSKRALKRQAEELRSLLHKAGNVRVNAILLFAQALQHPRRRLSELPQGETAESIVAWQAQMKQSLEDDPSIRGAVAAACPSYWFFKPKRDFDFTYANMKKIYQVYYVLLSEPKIQERVLKDPRVSQSISLFLSTLSRYLVDGVKEMSRYSCTDRQMRQFFDTLLFGVDRYLEAQFDSTTADLTYINCLKDLAIYFSELTIGDAQALEYIVPCVFKICQIMLNPKCSDCLHGMRVLVELKNKNDFLSQILDFVLRNG